MTLYCKVETSRWLAIEATPSSSNTVSAATSFAMQPGCDSLEGTNISDDCVNSTIIPTQAGPSLQTPGMYFRAIISTLVLLVTFFGNLLVLYVFVTTRKLRNYTNYYIAGLAVADLISGGITPAMENVSWMSDSWPFGEALCTANVYINHLFLHATFLMTLTICIDRYRALTMPLKHLREKTLKHALIMMSFSYIVPFLVWTPLIIILPYSGVTERILPPLCYGSYGNHFPLLVFAIAVTYWLPLLLTVLIYGFVFRAVILRRRYERYETKDSHRVSINSKMSTTPRLVRQLQNGGGGNGDNSETQTSANDLTTMPATRQSLDVSSSIADEIENEGYKSTHPDNYTEFQEGVPTKERRTSYSELAKSAFKTHRPSVVSSKHRGRLASLRATRSLTYIIVVMVVSALPWSIFTFGGVLNSLSASGLREFKTMSWLVHLSSAANPFCYAACNPLFKQAFLHVLCCGRRGH